MYDHKSRQGSAHTRRYAIIGLALVEEFAYIGYAIAREKELKGWRRTKKVALIEESNPGWLDPSAPWFR